MTCQEIVKQLKRLRNPGNIAGMARFGINSQNTLGIPVPVLRKMARCAGKDHKLALQLWATDIHEARLLAGMVDDPARVTSAQMDKWAGEFDSWDVCDMACMNLFRHTPLAWKKVRQWAPQKDEWIKRGGFALMATLAVGDKKAKDLDFIALFPLILKGSLDERNFVKKAVNWALRQIGKRNRKLNLKALSLARRVLKLDTPSARWVAHDAIRELEDPKVRKRLKS
jgi:3-methyladenine DNA glycosylase AlkD